MKKTILIVDDSQFMKDLLEKSISKSAAEAKPQPLNELLCLTWFEKAEPGKECTPNARCENAETNGNCDYCRTMDGRGIEEINCYASTCDCCGELTMHEEMEMNEENQLGTCEVCIAKGLKA